MIHSISQRISNKRGRRQQEQQQQPQQHVHEHRRSGEEERERLSRSRSTLMDGSMGLDDSHERGGDGQVDVAAARTSSQPRLVSAHSDAKRNMSGKSIDKSQQRSNADGRRFLGSSQEYSDSGKSGSGRAPHLAAGVSDKESMNSYSGASNVIDDSDQRPDTVASADDTLQPAENIEARPSHGQNDETKAEEKELISGHRVFSNFSHSSGRQHNNSRESINDVEMNEEESEEKEVNVIPSIQNQNEDAEEIADVKEVKVDAPINRLLLTETPEADAITVASEPESLSISNETQPNKGRPWFATKDTEVTRRLRALLENQNEDERYIEESAFHFERRGINRLFSNDDERVDFWSSTGFHDETPRPKMVTTIKTSRPERHFLKGDVVIFPNPRRALDAPRAGRRSAEWTGRVVSSPYNLEVSVRAQRAAQLASHKPPPPSVVRRGSQGDDLYKVEVVAKRILGGILGAQDHEHDKIIADYQASRRSRDGGRRRRANFELLHVSVLESPDETRRRKLLHVVKSWLLRFLRRALDFWIAEVRAQRREEQRNKSATCIQSFWRCVLSRRLSLEKRIAAQLAADQRRRERERREEEERQRAAKAAREAYLREHGVSRDGVRFFETQEEMDAFYVRMERMCARIEKQVEKLASGLKMEALRHWRYYLRHVLPPRHLDVDALSKDVGGLQDMLVRELSDERAADELGDLDSKLSKVAARQATQGNAVRENTNQVAPWHAALGLRLPGLPTVGAHLSHLGKIVIDDMTQYEKFRDFQRGPTDSTAWLLKGAYAKVLFGAYPSGQAFKRDRKITSRSGAIASVLMAGVDTFVCLLNPEEVQRMADEHLHGLQFNEEADEICAEIRRELSVGVAATKEALDGASQRAARGRKVGYGRPQQEALDRAESNRLQEYRKAKANLDNFSEELQHVFFPMPRGGGHTRPEDDARLLQFCRDLELRLRRQERLCIFSMGGSGRAGVVASILLGRLYGLEPMQALRRVQRYHDTMSRFKGERPEAVPTCPRSLAQRTQVARVLELGGDAAMDTIVDRAWVKSPREKPSAERDVVHTLRYRTACARGGLLPSPVKPSSSRPNVPEGF